MPQQSFAQRIQQATTVEDSDLGCTALVVCGTVNSRSNAVDSDISTAASISPPSAANSAALRVGFGTPISTGARVKMLVSFTSGNALSLELVNNTFINTFASHGTNAKQTVNMGNLLNLSTLDSNVMAVEFTANSAFQELELRTGSTVGVNVGYSVQLYHVTATTFAAPLPVELASFTGKARAHTVELNWATASERNSAYFLVERAANAQGEYEPIGRQAAAGNSTQRSSYLFTDAQPAVLGCYRLRQVDLDGSTTYSPIVAVQATPTFTLQAYPSPTTGVLTVTTPVSTQFALLNRLGQVVQQGAILPDQAQKLDFSSQPDGVYFLREQATGTTVKVVKGLSQMGH